MRRRHVGRFKTQEESILTPDILRQRSDISKHTTLVAAKTLTRLPHSGFVLLFLDKATV